jgi:hypothetical protein
LLVVAGVVPVRAAGFAVLLAVALAPAAARAQARPAPPAAVRYTIVVAPLATLGSESTAGDVKSAQRLVASGLTALGVVDLVDHTAMLEAIKRAKRPELRACDGEVPCLTALGQLMGASYAVYGEVGGLGSAQVVYLKLVDVAAAREVRGAVLELGGARAPEQEAHAAATRLVLPSRYVGIVEVMVSVKGASIFIDGDMVSRSPARPLSMAVGEHALRVTHPEFRDFVRFVDVGFATTTRVDVALAPYDAVSGDIRRTGGGAPIVAAPQPALQGPTPWYGRWYTIAGGAAILFVTSAVVVGALAGGVDFDREKEVP